MASFVAFALVLATALVAHPVIAVCSLNQHAALSPRGQLSVYLNNCYSGATTYFAGNYTVVTISKDVYTLRFGDQLCGTAPTDNTYFEFAAISYADSLINYHSYQYVSSFSSYFPKTQIVCEDTTTGCQIDYSICMSVYGLKDDGTYVEVTDDEFKLDLKVVDGGDTVRNGATTNRSPMPFAGVASD